MDRNTIIGFSLLAVLLIIYVSYNSYNENQDRADQQRIADSIAKHSPQPRKDTTLANAGTPALTRDTAMTDSMRAALPPALRGGTPTAITLDNGDLALQFTSKGAFPVSAQLKDYKTYEGQPLYFFSGANGNRLNLGVTGVPGAVTTEDLNFVPTQQGPRAASFVADLGSGRAVQLDYALPEKGYMLDCKVRYTGFSQNAVPLRWEATALHTERDIATERTQAQVYYQYSNKDHDYHTIKDEGSTYDLKDGASHWTGFRMHYFSTALIAENGLTGARIMATTKLKDSTAIASQAMTAALPLKGDGTANLRWYIGPNHYSTLKSYGIGLDEMVPLGFGLFAFVKYINKWIIIPVFNFLHGTLGILNMGVIIMLLTIFIRLILSFFTYKSYLSTARMRVLKPEIDQLKAQYGDDQQKLGMEQMKLYRSAGVNPLGGCLPTLFQIPILFAMYYFFPSSIELRQEKFLWAHDLSTYDSVLNLGFNIPFYGDHVSLFTLLMTASSLFLALYNRNMNAAADNNPVMKYMPYVFPILLMGVFNKMAAALTFYYFFSNMISILQQFIIQKFVIDEKKIHAKMQEARNKPATPSKWAARMEEMQKKNAERMKNGPARK